MRADSSSQLSLTDGVVLLVAILSVLAAFGGDSGALLRASWSYAIEHEGAQPPQPLVTDLDGDGVPEVLIANPDGHLHVLTPASDRLMPADDVSSWEDPNAPAWRALPVRKAASLRSHTGMVIGRRPLAVTAGVLNDQRDAAGRVRQAVVALTEDWSVLAFDDQLRLLWEHSVHGGHHTTRRRTNNKPPRANAEGASEKLDDEDEDEDGEGDDAPRREVALLVSSQPIYAGDKGVVLVGRHSEQHSAAAMAEAGKLDEAGRLAEDGGGEAGGGTSGSGSGGSLLLLALGETHLCVLSLSGSKQSCLRLPQAPISPPVIGDFTGDGIADIIVPCREAHLGIRVAAGSGALLQKVFFCFLGLAVGLVALVRVGETTVAAVPKAARAALDAAGATKRAD